MEIKQSIKDFQNKIHDFFYWEIWNRLKGNNVPVVCICLMHDGKILAQTAQKNAVLGTGELQYVAPGGKVEVSHGEKLYQAVHREMKEETNLNVDILKKLGRDRNNKYELHWYLCVPMDISQLKVMEPGKQKELKFVDPADKSVNWTPGNQKMINKFLPVLQNYMAYTK